MAGFSYTWANKKRQVLESYELLRQESPLLLGMIGTGAVATSTKLEWLEVSLETRHGLVRSAWSHIEENGQKKVRYEIITPSPSVIVIDGKEKEVEAGEYTFCVDED